MNKSYLITVAAYIELNPVKANRVSETWDYRCSSIHAHIAGMNDGIVDVEPLLKRTGNWKTYLKT